MLASCIVYWSQVTLQALWPGFSRSFAAILGGRWARFRMMAAVEFSFLLGLVTLSAATAYEGLKHGKEMIALFGWEMPLRASLDHPRSLRP